MSKFGLGKGLSELKHEMGHAPEISILAGGERVVVRNIPISQIEPNPDQPRKSFDANELSDLAASIREKGVLQPVLLRKVDGREKPYEIIAGERRWRASKLAGITEIPALVKSVSDENVMEIALIENVQRENLNPIEEAAAYENLMKKCGYTIGDVTQLISKSESYIRNIMRLDALPDFVKDLVKSGELSASHARAIAVSKNPIDMANKIIAGGMTVSDTEKMVKSAPRSSKSRSFTTNSMSAEDISKFEKQIKNKIGFPVKIREKKGGAGEIIISFANRIQMNELISKLLG